MTESSLDSPCRRDLLTKLVPVCAMSCLLGRSALASPQDDAAVKDSEHKFDAPFSRPLTQAQFFQTRYREVAELGQFLSKELGKDKTVDLLKRATSAKLDRYGAYLAKQGGSNSLESFVSQFRSPSYDDTLTKTVVTDTETDFELEVTECLWAKTFRGMDAADIGFAHVCFGDYAWVQGFNPKITMTRDKTLMQGDACCNHHYTWEK